MKYSVLVFLAIIILSGDSEGALLRRGVTSPITCAPCSKEVCCYNECSANDPYTCTAGFGVGWCSNSPTHWSEVGYDTCQACCELSSCDPDEECEVRPIRGNCLTPCPIEVCVVDECPMKRPFVCTLGTSKGRCDNRSTYFTEYDENCSECCDKSACARTEPTCYKRCSNDVCDRRQCTSEEPFVCVKADTGNEATNPIYGCDANETYWLLQDNVTCDDCCDVRLCLWAETPIPLPPETATVTDSPLAPETTSSLDEVTLPPGRIQVTTEIPRASKTSRSHAKGSERRHYRD